jgi:hypothetical protein
MNMHYLNLAPDFQKQKIQKEFVFVFAHNIIGIILVVFCISSILLVLARFSLIGYFTRLKSETSLVNVERQSLNINVSNLNKKIETASKVQKNFIKWTHLLNDSTNLAPEGAILNFMHISSESKTIRITGIAQNRESLIGFKEALEESNFLSSIEAPLSNLLEKENINFRFSGKLKENIYITPK